MTTLSVLICTCNRPELLAQALGALIERTKDKPDEVVVVNGGDERSDVVVRSFSDKGQVLLVKTTNRNLAASRNLGLPMCTGDIIAMTDDDAEVFPDWIAEMKRAHAEHPEAGAVGGPVVGADLNSLASRLADRVTFPRHPKARAVRTLPGVNVSYKRAAILQVGPQDEALFRGEDVDYNWRVQQRGWRIFYDPHVRVVHHHRPSLRAFLNQHYMYGRAYYLVRRKWPEMYCVYPHSLQRPKDIFKALNFVMALLYEPLWYALLMDRPSDKLVAAPILFLNGIGWRAGIIRQRMLSDGS